MKKSIELLVPEEVIKNDLINLIKSETNLNKELTTSLATLINLINRKSNKVKLITLFHFFINTKISIKSYQLKENIKKELNKDLNLSLSNFSRIKSYITTYLFHLAIKNFANFNFFPNVNLSQTISSLNVCNLLPKQYKILWLLTSQKNVLHAENMGVQQSDLEMGLSILEDLKEDARHGATVSWRRLLFFSGAEEISQVNEELFKKYEENEKSVRYFGPLKPLINSWIKSGLQYNVPNTTNKKNNWTELRTNVSENEKLPGEYNILSKGHFYFIPYKNQFYKVKEVFSRKITKETILINKIKLDKNLRQWRDLSEIDIDGYWSNAIKSYLSINAEKGTIKTRTVDLSFLSFYIFGYLRQFFDNNDVSYAFPNSPENFLSYLYVRHDSILIKNAGLEDSLLPLTLLDFLDNYYGERLNNNSIKSRINRISNFFDFILLNYSNINGYRLTQNPISYIDTKSFRGVSYRYSQKNKLDFDYFIMLRLYVRVLSKKLINYLENKDYFKFSNEDIAVNDYFEFSGNKIEIKYIKSFGFTKAKPSIFSRRARGEEVFSYLCNRLIMLDIMLNTGLRYSNIAWLDRRSYGASFANDKLTTSQTKLHINTDKSKLSEFDSYISHELADLIQKYEKTLDSYKLCNTPIYYQNNKKSKWGKILLLFPSESSVNKEVSHSHLITFYEFILFNFERCLNNNNINFNSTLYYKPERFPGDFEKRKSYQTTNPLDFIYTLTNTKNKSDYLEYIPFTPVTLRSKTTLHSLRKTFVSFNSLGMNPKDIGSIFTGQSEVVVGYYTDNSLDEKIRGKELLSDHIKTLPKLVDRELNADITKKLQSSGLAALNAFHLDTIKVPELKNKHIDDLLRSLPIDNISINRTHICPYNNVCPRSLQKEFDGLQNCAICPFAISTINDAPAIASTIKFHSDQVKEYSNLLKQELSKIERDKISNQRVESLTLMSSWLLRLKILDDFYTSETYDNYVVLSSSVDQVNNQLVRVKSDNSFIQNMLAVQNIPTLQSETMKKIAKRLSRKLLNTNLDIPDVSEVETACLLIKKVADLHSLTLSDIEKLVNKAQLEHSQSPQKLLKELEGLSFTNELFLSLDNMSNQK